MDTIRILLGKTIISKLFWWAFISLGISVATSSIGSGAVIVVPSSLSGTEGNANNVFPYSIGGTSMRYQQVFASSQFSALLPGGEFIIQLAFRPDFFVGSPFASSLPNMQIDLSTTSAGPDVLSGVFASNVGADNTVVFGPGPLPLASTDAGGPPRNFDILINLTTPFFYNPAAGNLLLDVRNFGGGTTTVFDAVFMFSDAVSRVESSSVSATGGFPDTLGLVTQFTTTPNIPAAVPEPQSLLLLGSALAGLGFWRRRQA